MRKSTPATPRTPGLRAARRLARAGPDCAHAEQVTRLADGLRRAFEPLAPLAPREAQLLSCAALLHDLGMAGGVAGHHKRSRDIILAAHLPGLSDRERAIVAAVARYHRKAHPARTHKLYRSLSPKAQDVARRLAALLRIADGLDRAHGNAVRSVAARREAPGRWVLELRGPGDLRYAAWGAARKGRLFELVFGVRLRISPAA